SKLNCEPLGDAMKPRAEGVMNPEMMSFSQKNQKSRLNGVLGVVGIAKQGGADAEDHWPMPLDHGGKCELGHLAFGHREAFPQLAIGKVSDRAQLIERPKLPGRERSPAHLHDLLAFRAEIRCLISSA